MGDVAHLDNYMIMLGIYFSGRSKGATARLLVGKPEDPQPCFFVYGMPTATLKPMVAWPMNTASKTGPHTPRTEGRAPVWG
jgi:hypothetical protein